MLSLSGRQQLWRTIALPAARADSGFFARIRVSLRRTSIPLMIWFSSSPPYAASIAQVIGAVAASLARAPDSPRNFNARGNSVQGVKLSFNGPQDGDVD